jgi:hypothetical protein
VLNTHHSWHDVSDAHEFDKTATDSDWSAWTLLVLSHSHRPGTGTKVPLLDSPPLVLHWFHLWWERETRTLYHAASVAPLPEGRFDHVGRCMCKPLPELPSQPQLQDALSKRRESINQARCDGTVTLCLVHSSDPESEGHSCTR